MRTTIYAAAIAGSLAATSAGAVTFTATNGGPGTFAASAADAQYTFESAVTGSGGEPAGFARTGGQTTNVSINGIAANPFGATSGNGFLYVTAGGISTISALATTYQIISFYVGSIDLGNTVSLLAANGSILASYDGDALASPIAPDGQQTLPQTNRLITFVADAGEAFSGISFSSSVNSLEVDNVRFATAVPEPATWAMMLVGFAMVGAAARYRRRLTNVRFA
ncbi:PEPxxWA-CTERM sorting domain-containing protein [Sphingomonas sp. 1P08PE]|uniref:Npun_F0296 family exosortase-dependent surface protein n=1 Tax=Sphingomonas sp. 1P08PE TaxID=554122 RepID=UPI0039A0651A